MINDYVKGPLPAVELPNKLLGLWVALTEV